ncbi:hypothetical protein OTU49_013753, partial [Cherax quadricarinatus]
MKTLTDLRGLLSPGATNEERQPIMTPVEHLDRQSERAARDNQSPSVNGIELSTNYNAIQVPPLATAAVQDPHGGFLGPETFFHDLSGPRTDPRRTTEDPGRPIADSIGRRPDPGGLRRPPHSWTRSGKWSYWQRWC